MYNRTKCEFLTPSCFQSTTGNSHFAAPSGCRCFLATIFLTRSCASRPSFLGAFLLYREGLAENFPIEQKEPALRRMPAFLLESIALLQKIRGVYEKNKEFLFFFMYNTIRKNRVQILENV